jgi:hypothetical protein
MTAEAAPMPPPRPPELGGLGAQADAAIVPPAPVADTPIIGMGGGGNAEGASLMAGGAPIADAGSAIGGAAGGMAGLDGILGGIGGLVKAFGGGGKGGGAPPAKAPQFSPSNAGPTVDAEIAKDRQQAPQIMAGLLADDVKSLIDPRKQRLA